MPYELRIIAAPHGLAELAESVAKSVAATGSWEAFFEVRMAAGPSVRVQRLPGHEDLFHVSVSWGSQKAEMEVFKLEHALEGADRLAAALYDARSSSRVR